MGKTEPVCVEQKMLQYANVLERMADTCDALNIKVPGHNEFSEVFGRQLRGQGLALRNIAKSTLIKQDICNERFRVKCGIASKSKSTNDPSGDQYLVDNVGNGKTLLALADGMGTGVEASLMSRMVLDLLRDALQSGMAIVDAIELVNMMLAVNDQCGNPVTLDICLLNEELGIAEFVKLGAVATFVQRKEWIEMIQSETMPMGVLWKTDLDRTVKKMYANDYLVMVTDGVLESIPQFDKERAMVRMIERNNEEDAQAIAERILREIERYSIKDDATILVAKIYGR